MTHNIYLNSQQLYVLQLFNLEDKDVLSLSYNAINENDIVHIRLKLVNHPIPCPKWILITACANKGIDFKVSYDNMASFGQKKVDGGLKIFSDAYITSQEELISLCDEWNNKSFDENDEYYNSDLNTFIRLYNDEYFELNNLIIIEFETGQGIKTKVKNVNIEENRLVVTIKQKEKITIFGDSVVTTEAFSWVMIVEVSKENTIGVTELVVDLKK